MTLKQRILLSALPMLFSLTGCINISYDGEAESPLPPNEKVALYFSPDQIPKVPYKKLGTAVASANSTYTAAEVESDLKKFARTKGANGVLIVRIKRTPAGMARPDQINNERSYSWIPDDTSHNSYTYFREDMTTYGEKENAEKMTYDISISAELLKVSPIPKKEKKP